MHALDVLIYVTVVTLTAATAGARAGGRRPVEIMSRLVGAALMAGMLRVLVAPEWIQQRPGRGAGHRGIFAGFVAGILTLGGPPMSFPLMAVFYRSGASLSARVAYTTSWSLFGFRRILAWELPFMGTRSLPACVLPTLVFPSVAGHVVRLIYNG